LSAKEIAACERIHFDRTKSREDKDYFKR